ncbi:MAG: GntR family transcriptional regulator [Beijerinckiaceae bacterium]|nr:GntR family transcriptional regulator [Beijerinckiaceae bacterium]
MKNPILSRTLAGAIVERVRQEILSGEHAPGAQLRQDALAASYGVSRIPVREALLQLEAEGLVAIEPHRGAVVTPLSPEEINDVFALRRMLEPRLICSSIPELSADDLAGLDAIQGAFAAAIEAGDAGRWGRLNAELHLAMYARARQPRTLAIVASLLQISERYTRLQLATREAWERATREHAELIAFCRKREAEAAAKAVEAHIATVHADLAGIVGLG